MGNEIREYALKGFLVGPNEDEESFLKRVKALSKPSLHDSEESYSTKNIFGITVPWIDVIYSNKGLPFWQGGFVVSDGITLQLQLRKEFEKKKKHLWIYSKEEILSHENVHAARMAFDEGEFEEILAYQTSSSWFRRYWGPFFRTPKESSLLLFLLGSAFFCNLFSPLPFWFWALTGGVLVLGIFRLWRLQRLFSRCLKKLSFWLGSRQNALKITICLTDHEIKECSRLAQDKVEDYFLEKKNKDLRWKQITSIAARLYTPLE